MCVNESNDIEILPLETLVVNVDVANAEIYVLVMYQVL
jgi:hypothetical protein